MADDVLTSEDVARLRSREALSAADADRYLPLCIREREELLGIQGELADAFENLRAVLPRDGLLRHPLALGLKLDLTLLVHGVRVPGCTSNQILEARLGRMGLAELDRTIARLEEVRRAAPSATPV